MLITSCKCSDPVALFKMEVVCVLTSGPDVHKFNVSTRVLGNVLWACTWRAGDQGYSRDWRNRRWAVGVRGGGGVTTPHSPPQPTCARG